MRARDAVNKGRPCKSLPKEDEAHKMGGEWSSLSLLDGTKLLVVDGTRIYIPKAARERVMESIHTSHGKGPAMVSMLRLSYFWPRMHQECLEHAKVCDTCLDFRKAKARAEGIQHSEVISNLNLMDQVSTDLLEIHEDKSKHIILTTEPRDMYMARN